MHPNRQEETSSTNQAASDSSFILPPNAAQNHVENPRLHSARIIAGASLCCLVVSLSFLISGSMLASGASYSLAGVVVLLCCGSCCGCYAAIFGGIGASERRRENLSRNRVQILPELAVSVARPELINYFMDSPYDYRSEAALLLNNLSRLDAKTIIDSANCFYLRYANPRDLEEIKSKFSNLGVVASSSDELAAQISVYSQNMITPDYKHLGQIRKAETSQALFYGFLVALTQNPDHFSCTKDPEFGVIENDLLKRLNEMPQAEKDVLLTKFNTHLTSLASALSNDQTGTLAIGKVRELLQGLNSSSKEKEEEQQKGQDWDVELGQPADLKVKIKPSGYSSLADPHKIMPQQGI